MFVLRDFTPIVVGSLIAGAVMVGPRVAEAGCALFQDRDFAGPALQLADNERARMVEGVSPVCASTVGATCSATSYWPAFNDQVSSVKVGAGCSLILWQDAGEGGARFRAGRDYDYVGAAWDDVASEALCECR